MNRTNRDFGQFDFGITVAALISTLDVRIESPDRHHVVEELSIRDFEMPDDKPLDKAESRKGTRGSTLDFRLKPFNRGDVYSFRLAIAPLPFVSLMVEGRPVETTVRRHQIQISTPETGVRFEEFSRSRPRESGTIWLVGAILSCFLAFAGIMGAVQSFTLRSRYNDLLAFMLILVSSLSLTALTTFAILKLGSRR